MAAERVSLDNLAAKASLTGGNTVHSLTGLSSDELKVVRTRDLGNGKSVTRYQQFHQGIPVWNEVIVARTEAGASAPSLTGPMLQGLAKDLPSAK
ncbi:MAG: hemagglutinin, partial [Nanoarchaeota archaeon]